MANYFMVLSRICFHPLSFGAAFISVTFISATVEASFTPFVAYQADGTARSYLPSIPNTAPRSEVKTFSDGDHADRLNSLDPIWVESPTLDAPVATDGGSAGASAHALAYAGLGIIRLELSGSAQRRISRKSQLGGAEVTSTVFGGWEDVCTFSTPNPRIGRAILMKGYIKLHGSLSGSATSMFDIPTSNFSSTRVGFHLIMNAGLTDPLAPMEIGTGDGSYHAAFRTSSNPAHLGYNYPIPPLIPFSILAVENQPFELLLKATLEAHASAKITASYTVPGSLTALFFGELGHTIRWGGIESVTDYSTGQPIDDWTISSESGFDYSKPLQVPEPSSLTLLCGCFATWATLRRRCHSWASHTTGAAHPACLAPSRSRNY